jgi:hypothetical protein
VGTGFLSEHLTLFITKLFMKSIKRVIKLAGLVLLILLAACGAGFMVGLPRRPEQDRDNETKTELVEGTEEDMNGEQRT